MAVKKLGFQRYESGLLPGQIFDNEITATHFDNRERLKRTYQKDREVEEMLAPFSTEQIANFQEYMVHASDAALTDELGRQSAGDFIKLHPEIAYDGQGGHGNANLIRGVLIAQGQREPFGIEQFERAWDFLLDQNQLVFEKGHEPKPAPSRHAFSVDLDEDEISKMSTEDIAKRVRGY